MTPENQNILKSFVSWPFGILICGLVCVIAVLVIVGAVVAALTWPLLVALGLMVKKDKKV